MKCFISLLLFQFILITIGQPLKKIVNTDATSANIIHRRAHRYPRALKPDLPACSLNQYFDEDEGRCLGVTGGGRVLYISGTNSCRINTLQPHCTNPSYYYICKNNKTILAQCLQGQHFENRLQKCVNVDPDKLRSSTVQPNLETFESIQLPECKKPGTFPVPDDCALFYTCETNGHRMFQNIFRCPTDMAYNMETEMCSFSPSCEKESSNVPFCTPVIQKEKRNVEESTSTESVTHITDSDETDKTGAYEISTKENIEGTTVTNTVSVTTYDNDEPTSTSSSNDLTSTELIEVTGSTEYVSNTLHSLDTEASTAYSVTNEKELSSTEDMNRLVETTTIMDSTPETEKSVEESVTDVTEITINDAITSDKDIQTTETSVIVTEKVAKESTVKATEITTAPTMAPADLSIFSSTEIQITEIDKTDSVTEGIVEQNSTKMNDPIVESSNLEDSELNEHSSTIMNKLNNDTPASNENPNTKPTLLSATTISMVNNIQDSAVDSNIKNVSSISTIAAVSSSNNIADKQNATSKENDITEKEFVTALKTILSSGRISADIILPIMSAVLSIIDTLERYLIHILTPFRAI